MNDKEIPQLEKAKTLLEGLFPGLGLFELGYGNKDGDHYSIDHYQLTISAHNSNFRASDYAYDKNSIVHFSNLPALESIISGKSLRLYNLHNLNDPREFTFASKIFKIENKRVNDAKENIHLLSFCDNEILRKKHSRTEFNMWRLYGRNGKGVALEFSIQNDPSNWQDFHLSRVVYGAKNRKKFEKLRDGLEEINQSKPTIEVDFSKLFMFHKSLMYELEKEVRLVYDRRELRAGMNGKTISMHGETIFPNIKTDLQKLTSSPKRSRFLEIPMEYHGLSHIDDSIPLLRLERINLGYRLKNEEDQIKEVLELLCVNSLGYMPQIKLSNLHKYYWD